MNEPERPNPALTSLDVMAGTWNLEGREFGTGGRIQGQVRSQWMDGGFYFVQHVEIDHAGRRVTGAEYVGYDSENENLKSYFFSNGGPGSFGGVALEFVWELDGESITIWAGGEGSPAHFNGAFSDDQNTIAGRWDWPGGGYEATMKRVDGTAP